MAKIVIHKMNISSYRIEYAIDTADMSSIYPPCGLGITVSVDKLKNRTWYAVGYAEYQGQFGRKYFVWSNSSNVPKYVRKLICQLLPQVFERMQVIAATVNRSIGTSYIPDKNAI